MVVCNLVEKFILLCRQRRDQLAYEAISPALFDHYHRYWCPRCTIETNLSDEELRSRARTIICAVDSTAARLKQSGLDTDGIQVVLLVGGETSNGHAFQDRNGWVVWFPVETYSSARLARAFVAHEFAHALHYRNVPEFYFIDEDSRTHLGRQLITEGVATYLTGQIMGLDDTESLWADFLTDHQRAEWYTAFQQNERELVVHCRTHFDGPNLDPRLFQAEGRDCQFAHRAGYLIGLRLVQHVCRTEELSLKLLLGLPRNRFESLAREYFDRRVILA